MLPFTGTKNLPQVASKPQVVDISWHMQCHLRLCCYWFALCLCLSQLVPRLPPPKESGHLLPRGLR
jgi:hypothetical protein